MFLLSVFLVASLLPADMTDTLQAVNVIADRGVVVSRTDTAKITNPISITDALEKIPGLYVGDNGGAAGLKSVSIRGLGSAHTAIYIDGVRVGNVQSGQADLGMLDLGQFSHAVIDYAQNSISFETAKPVFSSRAICGQVRFRGGSWNTYEPSVRLGFRLSDRLCMSAAGNGIFSRGDFPFGGSRERRANNDIRLVHTGLDLWGTMNGGNWHTKIYYNGSERGTPGSVEWLSQDRQKDRNAFIQSVVRKQFTPQYLLLISTKASYDDILYITSWENSRYRQGEVQVNSSHKFSIRKWFEVSLAADFQWDGLKSDGYDASRSIVTSTATAAFHPDRFKADIAVEYAGYFDRNGKNRNVFLPSIDIKWNAFEGFNILSFCRRAYRMPTFNELYFPGYGNPDLTSEDAILSDIGASYCRPISDKWKLSVKADGFFNILKDKIISAPTAENPSIWLPYNIGKVRMTGADIQTDAEYNVNGFHSKLSVRYSYMDAVDRTTGSTSFGTQIPFITRHTVCLGAEASIKGWKAAIDWNWRGGRIDSTGGIADYNTLNLALGKEFHLGDNILGLNFIARNLADCRYELTSGYPMPGRSLYGTIEFKF